jgi:hypothetical protein
MVRLTPDANGALPESVLLFMPLLKYPQQPSKCMQLSLPANTQKIVPSRDLPFF